MCCSNSQKAEIRAATQFADQYALHEQQKLERDGQMQVVPRGKWLRNVYRPNARTDLDANTVLGPPVASEAEHGTVIALQKRGYVGVYEAPEGED